jgi:hypothetical protein
MTFREVDKKEVDGLLHGTIETVPYGLWVACGGECSEHDINRCFTFGSA